MFTHRPILSSQILSITLFGTTGDTIAAIATRAVRFIWQGMAANTMRLAAIDRRYAIAARRVFNWLYQLEMVRVTATSIVADEMVKIWNIGADALRDWPIGPCVHEAVGHLLSAMPPEATIPVSVEGSSPVPAAGYKVNGYLIEKALDGIR